MDIGKVLKQTERLMELVRYVLYSERLLETVCMLVIPLCPVLWHPMDYSQPDSSVHGILQARTLEWVAMLFSRGFS